MGYKLKFISLLKNGLLREDKYVTYITDLCKTCMFDGNISQSGDEYLTK
jgi:hypothetical protein